MKKVKKIIVAIVLVLTIFCFINLSFGSTIEESEFSGFTIEDLEGESTFSYILTAIGNNIVNILTTIGIVISVITLIVLGIKYMLGSVEEKAEYKKTLMPYVIGAGLVFAASAIAQMIYELAIQI